MDFILIAFGQYAFKRNVKLITVLQILLSGVHPLWDQRSNSLEGLWEKEGQRDYILMKHDDPSFVVIKSGSNTFQITTKILREQLEKTLASRIIKEHLL